MCCCWTPPSPPKKVHLSILLFSRQGRAKINTPREYFPLVWRLSQKQGQSNHLCLVINMQAVIPPDTYCCACQNCPNGRDETLISCGTMTVVTGDHTEGDSIIDSLYRVFILQAISLLRPWPRHLSHGMSGLTKAFYSVNHPHSEHDKRHNVLSPEPACFVNLERRMQVLCDVTLSRCVRIHLGVKVKVKVNITLEQATKAQRRSRGIAVLFL